MINVKYSLDGHVLMIMGFMLDVLLSVGMELGLEINYFLGVVTTLILTLEMDASNAKFNHCMFVILIQIMLRSAKMSVEMLN